MGSEEVDERRERGRNLPAAGGDERRHLIAG